jgi:predicted molibdopterin-dependent oxidoreductase YjgC
MAKTVEILVNGLKLNAPAGSTVAAALAEAGATAFRTSVSGEPRGPLCGMGVCFECRVTIDGRQHLRSCQILCKPGMEVRTDV